MKSQLSDIRRFLFRNVLGIPAVLSATACMPVIGHGPQVRQGSMLGLAAGLEYRPVSAFRGESLTVPTLGLSYSRGWRSAEPGNGALQFGLHVPVHPAMTQADLYYQFPPSWTGSMAAGAGVNASYWHVMPYLQIGRIQPNGRGWYTTQALLWKRDNNYQIGDDPLDSRAVAWTPGIAYQQRRTRSTFHWFLNGGLGTGSNLSSERGEIEGSWYALNAGMLVFFHR